METTAQFESRIPPLCGRCGGRTDGIVMGTVLSTLAQVRLSEMQAESEWRIEAVIVCPGCGELEDDCGCGEDGPVAVLVTL